jgi:hypothetical protein
MQLKPALNAGEQTATAVLRRVEATGRLSTSQYSSGSQVACHWSAFAGQAAAELHHDLRLRQFAHRFAVAQPQVGARQRLPGLRQDIADQRPAEVCAHSATFPSAALILPATTTPRFAARRTSRAASRFPSALTQPGFIALPPVAELLLPLHAGLIHIAIQRFGERTVDMHPAGVQRPALVDG